jgi:hypothetical protein
MDFMFLGVPPNAEAYLQEKFLDDPANEKEKERISRLIDNTRKNTDVPQIAAESDFFDLDRNQMRMIEIAKRCAIQSLAVEYPLNAGEEIEGDFFSYLTAPWHDVPAFTGVLKRKTNMAEILYFFDSVRIGQDGILHLPFQQPDEEPPPPRGLSMSVVSTFIQSALKKLGPKIGGAIAEKLGAVVMKLVMKEVFGIDDDTTKIIKEVERIVKEEIETNEITRVQGTINGTLSYLSGEYFNLKRSKKVIDREARKELTQGITPYSNKFYTDVVGLLETDKYEERGLKVYLFGATVHLMLTQELALVDPDEIDPNQSSYLITLRDNAKKYKAHVQRVYQSAMANRNRFRVFSERTIVESGNRYITSIQWYWQDEALNQRHGPFGSSKNPDKSAEQNAHDDMEQFKTRALTEKREQLGNPEDSFLGVIDGVANFEGFSK